jgi:heat shock protein HtpX
MSFDERYDIYEHRLRNRRRLTCAFALFTLVILVLSGLGLFLIYKAFDLNVAFWVVLVLFWLVYAIYIILRYALGFRRIFSNLNVLPSWQSDNRLEDALSSARLACGMIDHVRLLIIPNADINSFSLALPDGTFALLATQGIADKLSGREREAVMAHEIAHMLMGDSLIHTIMIRLAGRRSMKRMASGLDPRKSSPLRITSAFIMVGMLLWIALITLAFSSAENGPSPQGAQDLLVWLAIPLLFLVFAEAFPLIMYKLLQLILDKRREYYADMEAVYLTRDPEAVYRALLSASEDVLDVMLLPACFDALLLHPVVNYAHYAPFRTQPTMAERMRRIQSAYPQVDK